MSDEARRELEEIRKQLNALGYRVRELERRMAAESAQASQPSSPAAPKTPTEPSAALRPTAEPSRASLSAGDASLQWFEQLLGGKVALYTGITLILLAAAFFMGWAWTRLSPEGRLMLGYLGGFALLGLGGLARRRAEGWFVDGLMGAGLAALYLTTWTGWERYQLFTYAGAFMAMGATTVLGVALAWRRNSQTLAIVATLGGFAAPIWLNDGNGGGSPLNFFSYLTALNLGMLSIASVREWRLHQAVCLASTVILLYGWALDNYKADYRLITLGFITLYYGMFSAVYLLPDVLRRRAVHELNLGQFVLASIVYLPVGYALSREAWGDYPGALFASFSAIYILVSWWMYHRQDAPTALSFATLGVICLAAAIAVQFQPSVQAFLYSLFAAALIIVALRYELRIIYGFGVLMAFGSTVALWGVITQPIRTALPLLNEHGVAWLGWMAGACMALYELNRACACSRTRRWTLSSREHRWRS